MFGDPDVKYVPGGAGCQFIYSSIEVVGLGAAPNYSGTAQTMSVHRSVDCGHTWTGPFEVTPATNPHGLVDGNGNARDAADKEFVDVDPETNRVLLSWSNFSNHVEISTTFSDNIMSATPPTWSARLIVTPGAAILFNTGSMPRFAGNGSTNAYVTWSRKDFSESTPYGGDACGNTMFSRSTNNGASWSVPIKLHSGGICTGGDFWPMDQIPGDDRIHSFPAMAVDTTPGTHGGWIYIVYAGNDSKDGGDIHFVKSTDAGVSFSAPVKLNARPGSDRSQWFPYIAVASTGRVYATWYDQQFVSSGDVTETLMTYSDDGGVTWSRPAPITDRPFRAGFGNDTGQPNIGDYIGATTNGGNLYAAWAGTAPTILFTDGQPDPAGRFTVPDLYFAKTSTAKAALKQGTISSAEVAGFSNGNGNIDPGERINVTIPLTNFVTNATVGAASYIGVSGTLTSSTAGVSIVTGTQAYGTVAAGATGAAAGPYVIQLAGGFVAGTRIDLSLAVTTSGGGSTTLRFRLDTGTPVAATVFSEDFNGVAPGTLPAGWTTIHQGAARTPCHGPRAIPSAARRRTHSSMWKPMMPPIPRASSAWRHPTSCFLIRPG